MAIAGHLPGVVTNSGLPERLLVKCTESFLCVLMRVMFNALTVMTIITGLSCV